MDIKLVYFLATLFVLTVAEQGLPSVCPRIKTRSEWGARAPVQIEYSITPVKYAIIHHTVTPECHTEQNCIDRVLNMQSYHIDSLKFYDIGYNFLVAPDGTIYEGVGWHKIGAHTKGYNANSIGIGFIGDYDQKYPSSAAVRAVQNLLECGVLLGELETHYRLIGGRQVRPTNSPGLSLYREIQTWPHYTAYP